MSYADQGKILNHFIAEGAAACHEHARRGYPVLVPAWNQALPCIAILLQSEASFVQ